MSQDTGAQGVTGVENIRLPDVIIGPDGRDPSIALPRIQHFLLDEDSYREPNFKYKLDAVSKYLEEANDARLRGDLGYDNRYVTSMLEDARILVKVHLDFEKWKDAPTRWTGQVLPTPRTSRRLPPLPDQPIPRPPNKKRATRHKKWVDLGANSEARDNVFFRVFEKGKEELDRYQADEERYFEANRDPGKIALENSNKFLLDNEEFESHIAGGIVHTSSSQRPEITQDTASFYKARGWQRAAIQQCLNMFTSHENRVINTPWRRVVFPYNEPVPLPKEIVYHARTIPPNRVSEDLKDPFPWVYWYGQYSQLMDLMTGWERRRYNVNHWSEFNRPALPMNSDGPYLNEGLSVYEDHWLKIGAYLRRLHELMHDAVNKAPRPFMLAILRDIKGGLEWEIGQPAFYRNDRLDIMRRDVDEENGYDSPSVLIDEADAAWLRFLCEPSRNWEMCDPAWQAKDNLAILFETRLNDFFRNSAVSGVSKIPGENVFDVDVEAWAKDYCCISTPVRDVLAYINGGPNASESEGNDTYQFTLEEANEYLVHLGELGRCVNMVEEDGTIFSVSRPPYNLHPEHRIQWRHENHEAFIDSQSEYREVMIENYMVSHEIDTEPKKMDEDVLEHLGISHILRDNFARARKTSDPGRVCMALLRALIYPENRWVQGSYGANSIEEKRESPSWSDLMDWRAVGQVAKPNFEKMEDLPVPEKTVQFFRNLAFRMGRTLAHVQEIEHRLQFSKPAREPAVTSSTPQPNVESGLWKPISKQSQYDAIQHWKKSIDYGAGELEFMPPSIDYVVKKADVNGTVEREFSQTFFDFGPEGPKHVKPYSGWDVVRAGLVNDCVENRNTLYPGRYLDFEDSSGYFKSNADFKPNKLFAANTRPSLFKWATEAQRRYQAPYTRKAFFSMKRWPVSFQSPQQQDIIRRRADEIQKVDPSLNSQRYGILTPRLDVLRTKRTIPVSGTKDNQGTKPPSETDGTRDATPTKPTGVPGTSKDDEHTSALPRNNASDNMSTATAEKPQQQPKPQGPTRRLIPLRREREKWVPGPAVFPMAETLLQQIALSENLTRLIYPEPELKWFEKVANLYNSCTKLTERRVPLLPDASNGEITRSNPNKRKIPADFILEESLRPGKVRVIAKPKSQKPEPVRTQETTQTEKPGQIERPIRQQDKPKPTGPGTPAGPSRLPAQKPGTSSQNQEDSTIENTQWWGVGSIVTTLTGAFQALINSAKCQQPDIRFPDMDILTQTFQGSVEEDKADWRDTLKDANDTLQALVGPGKVFPLDTNFQIGVAMLNPDGKFTFGVIPTGVDQSQRGPVHIWIAVNTMRRGFGGMTFNREDQEKIPQ